MQATPRVTVSQPAVAKANVAAATILVKPVQSGTATQRATVTPRQVVNAKQTIVRDHRVLARPTIPETRIFNPLIADRLHDIRVFPLPRLPACPAGQSHDLQASSNYTLVINRPGADGQSNWRQCRKCKGLAFGDASGGVCPSGGSHDFGTSSDYVVHHGTPVPAGHQDNWCWCRKCQGMAFSKGSPSVCPAGGAHDHNGSSVYSLSINQPEAEGQPNWRWCSKCMGLVFAGGEAGATREELGLPVASSDPVVDSAAFDASTGPQRFHLPRYRLASRFVNGSEQYLIRMAKDDVGQWSLSVTLDKLRPEGLPDETTELEHDLLLQIGFSLTLSGGGATTKSLDFTELGETDDGQQIVARLHFASPAERDQVLAAITTPEAGCGITALRTVRVAAPIAGNAGRFRPVTRGLEQHVAPDPLFLHPDLHPYITDGVGPVRGGVPGLVMRQFQYEGRFHKYWEDATNPTRVFYLPDSFRLARLDKPAPFKPLMKVRQVDGETVGDDPMVALDFVATPWIDVKRLEAARQALAGGASGSGGAERPIVMEPLPGNNTSFWLALPGGTGGGLVERPGAQVDLMSAVVDSETLSRSDFRTVFDAMLGGGLSIMRGEVRVDFGEDARERIPFEARFDRMNGDVFEADITPGAEPGQFSVELRNAVESPLRVERLGASILAGQVELAARNTPSATLPLTLAPGESISVAIEPDGTIPEELAGASFEPLIDLDGVTVTPDEQAIIAAILEDVAPDVAGRTIRVKLFPGMFDAPSGDPAEQAVAIIVHFDNGTAVELTPQAMEQEARIAASLSDILLHGGGGGSFRYKTEIIRRTSRPVHPDWQTGTSDLLIPLLPEG